MAPRPLLSSPRHFATAFTILLLCTLGSPAVFAHKYPCVHNHAIGNPNNVITCTNPNTACTQNSKPGTCQTKQLRTRVACVCVPTPPAGGGGGCLALSVNFFSDQGDGAPTANTPFIYLAQGDQRNYLSINNGDLFGPEFSAKDNPVQGTVEMAFGSFSTPTAVPVTLEIIDLTLPSIFGSGINTLALPLGDPQPLLYDSTTGIVSSVDNSGVLVEVSNDRGSEVIPVYFSAELEAGGFLVLMQGASFDLIFPGNFETGDTSRWSSLPGLFLDFLTHLGSPTDHKEPLGTASAGGVPLAALSNPNCGI